MEGNVHEDSPRVLALAVGAWGAAVAIAQLDGAFTRFELSAVMAFAALASLYALAVFGMDRALRACAARAAPGVTRGLAFSMTALLAIAIEGESAALATFAAPLAAVALAAAFGTLRRRATSASSAKSPGATRAAT